MKYILNEDEFSNLTSKSETDIIICDLRNRVNKLSILLSKVDNSGCIHDHSGQGYCDFCKARYYCIMNKKYSK